MVLKAAEFEEGEYRGPLFNQLQTTNLVWEPGQVFEKHIGIDRAMWSANKYLLTLHGRMLPPAGVVLPYYDWNYIWTLRNRRKKLPSFRLNLFVQAKRPMYGRYAPKALKAQGLGSPYWRFDITAHQQAALEKLHSKLKGRAIVCYACPAFHKEAVLHKWTVQPKMVENSTFPDVTDLMGHDAWNFSQAGTFGVANADPTRKDAGPLPERLASLVEQSTPEEAPVGEELDQLSNAVTAAMELVDEAATLQQALFAEGVRDINHLAEEFDLEDGRNEFIAFATVVLFAFLHRLKWLVVGNGG